MSTAGEGDDDDPEPGIARFPPLPKLPDPPRLPPDPRQTRTARIVGNISGKVAGAEMRVSGPNFSTGFHASAVNLGQLQAVLETGLARFDDLAQEERWSELLTFIHEILATWIQRLKRARVERRGEGIRIELQTQDDRGYYDYAFDVFPHRDKQRPDA